MALPKFKLTEMPLTTHSPSLRHLLFSQTPKPSFHHHRLRPLSSSLRTTPHHSPKPKPKPKPNSPRSTPWLSKPKPPSPDQSNAPHNDHLQNKAQTAIDRIVLRLRNLGLGSDDEDEEEEVGLMGVTGEERLEDLLRREWVRPNAMLAEENEGEDVLPWEKEENEKQVKDGVKRRRVKAPSLAELTIEDEELRRLRRIGMHLRERISVPKAGITQLVLRQIHDKWRKEELVRLKFHEVLATDMKTAHDVVEVGF